tara:strand:- start:678 stop:944 length:267 start_codon:yes stop_codon:yes gene_type:complete
MSKTLNYIVVSTLDLSEAVSQSGGIISSNLRHSLNLDKVIFCINHKQEVIDSMFIDDFDYSSFLNNHDILSHQQTKELMATTEWSEVL